MTLAEEYAINDCWRGLLCAVLLQAGRDASRLLRQHDSKVLPRNFVPGAIRFVREDSEELCELLGYDHETYVQLVDEGKFYRVQRRPKLSRAR